MYLYNLMRKKIIFSWILIVSALSQIVFSARFSLSTASNTVYVDCPFEVKVYVNTQWQEVTAADMDLLYNDGLFDLKSFVAWDIFQVNRGVKKNRNRLRSTALSYPLGLSGAWLFATIIFEPTAESQETHIKFNIQWYGTWYTTDANLAFDGQDYLSETNEIVLNIEKGSCPTKISIPKSDLFDDQLSEEEFQSKWTQKVIAGSNAELYNSINSSGVDRSGFVKFWYWFVYVSGWFLLLMLIVVLRKRKKNNPHEH
jgi:hypothetical protein